MVQWIRNPPADARDTGPIPAQEDSACHGPTKPAPHNDCVHVQVLKPKDPRARAL